MPRSRKRWPALIFALALVAVAPTAALGEEPQDRPRADEILRRMSATLAAAKSFSFHAEINFDQVLPSGFKLQYAGAVDVLARRPNGLHVDYRDDLSGKRLWYDGETLTLLDRNHNVVASAPAAADIDTALDEFAATYGVSLPLADLVVGDAHQAMIEHVKRKGWIGVHDVDGVLCDHLAFSGDRLDWQVWVERGEQPLPRKVVVTYKTLPESPQYMANLMDWDLSAKASDASFVAKIPTDAVKADFLEIEEVRR